jgi:hypothetical protein
MLYREIIGVCYEIHTKHINTLCGQNAEIWVLSPGMYVVATGLKGVKLEEASEY